MSFGENLKNVRKQRGITQEELAEILGVSRQAISKWESDNGYPETEKLLLLSKTLNISLDYLMNDASEMQKKEQTEEKSVVIAQSGKIAITTHDKQNVIVCHSVKSSKITGFLSTLSFTNSSFTELNSSLLAAERYLNPKDSA